jgi:predicted nucleic acid-binding protein
VFVDSGGGFAHLVAEDASHAAALALFERALRDRWSLVTTNVVVIETYALLINRALEGRRIALEMLDDMNAGLCRVVRITAGDEAKAIALLRAQTDKSYSMCDAMSFIVMQRMRIADVIALDRHFRQYGRFNVLG